MVDRDCFALPRNRMRLYDEKTRDMTETPDRLDELLACARTGDETAYRRFLAEAAARLHRFVERRIGRDAEVEDIVQQCLIALHDKRATLDPGRPVAPWMYAIARYKLTDWLRYRNRRAAYVALEPADGAAGGDAARDLNTLLGRLPAAQSEAIRLTRIEGLTMREASDRTGVGVSALKLRVHRGIARLRQLVDHGPE